MWCDNKTKLCERTELHQVLQQLSIQREKVFGEWFAGSFQNWHSKATIVHCCQYGFSTLFTPCMVAYVDVLRLLSKLEKRIECMATSWKPLDVFGRKDVCLYRLQYRKEDEGLEDLEDLEDWLIDLSDVLSRFAFRQMHTASDCKQDIMPDTGSSDMVVWEDEGIRRVIFQDQIKRIEDCPISQRLACGFWWL